MKLQEMSIKELLTLHNRLAETPAGLKSFATKTKLIARIESIAATGNIDLESFWRTTTSKATEQDAQLRVEHAEAFNVLPKAERKPAGKGIGRLARELLLNHAGYPHALIAEMINRKVEGARATSKSVRWYACRMRKLGIEVPTRRKAQLAEKSANPLDCSTEISPVRSQGLHSSHNQ